MRIIYASHAHHIRFTCASYTLHMCIIYASHAHHIRFTCGYWNERQTPPRTQGTARRRIGMYANEGGKTKQAWSTLACILYNFQGRHRSLPTDTGHCCRRWIPCAVEHPPHQARLPTQHKRRRGPGVCAHGRRGGAVFC